jgi:hypothetical protein
LLAHEQLYEFAAMRLIQVCHVSFPFTLVVLL